MGNLEFKNEEEFTAAFKKFYGSHPEAPLPEDVECLDLIMKKVYAEQILAGTKKLEFREYKEFYIKRLIDSNVAKYIRAHADDEEVMTFCNDIRLVKKIHFHDYNKSWFLDVECDFVDLFSITKEDIEYLQEEYGCHDFDEDLRRMDAMNVPEDRRPLLFYLVCGKVIDTNLEVKSKDDLFVEFCGGKVIKERKQEKKSKDSSNKDVIKFTVSKEMFNEIVSGRLSVFEKEILPKKQGLYCLLNGDGSVKDINGVVQLRKYEAIQFACKTGTYTCEINSADIEPMKDENGDLITYTEKGEEYTATKIVYALGDEIEQEK